MNRKLLLLTIGLVSVVAVLWLVFNSQRGTVPNHTSNTTIENHTSSRMVIEKAYPEFKDFENQSSFAGQRVKQEVAGDTSYFAYIVLGSGVPVVKATCFSVSPTGSVEKVGAFPNQTDINTDYNDVNPTNCMGIKIVD